MSETMVPLLNPLSKEVSFEWKDDENMSHNLVIGPLEIVYFTEPQARFMLKHITDAVMNEKKLNGINNVSEIEEIIKQIKVTI